MRFLLLFGLLLCCFGAFADQVDSLWLQRAEVGSAQLGARMSKLSGEVEEQSEKYLARLEKVELKLLKKHGGSKELVRARQDSVRLSYQQLRENLRSGVGGKKLPYLAELDSLKTSLSFLQNSRIKNLDALGVDQEKLASIGGALKQVEGLESSLGKASSVQDFIRGRKNMLQEEWGQLGGVKELKQFQREVYYYQAQLQQYKSMIKDRKRMEAKAWSMIKKHQKFQSFMNSNSQLAQLFNFSGTPTGAVDPSVLASFGGLQTRASVGEQLVQLFGSSAAARDQLNGQLQSAQAELNNLMDQLPDGLGSSSREMEIPNFKPNTQRTKPFLQRLEYGANMQSQRGSGGLPSSSELALLLGYRINDRSSVGVGASYRWGWGAPLKDIRLSHEGVGMRSYVDWQLKKSIWLTGGYELLYNHGFQRLGDLSQQQMWQRSGLIGLMRRQSVGKMKLDAQLLWDFLSQGSSVSPPLKFRIGYRF